MQTRNVLQSAALAQLKIKKTLTLPNLRDDFVFRKMRSKDPLVTEFFEGGLRYGLGGGGGIVEVCGASGTGKTSFALSWCLAAQHALPITFNRKERFGLSTVEFGEQATCSGAAAVYISCDGRFPSSRFASMVEAYNLRTSNPLLKLSMDKLLVLDVLGLAELMFTVEHLLVRLLQSGKESISLIVIDSITANFRGQPLDIHGGDFAGGVHGAAKFTLLYSLVQRLQTLAETFGLVVLLTNQMTTVVSDRVDASSAEVVPAFGLSWSQLVGTRVCLESNPRSKVKVMSVAFSPYLSTQRTLNYRITNGGIEGVYLAYKIAQGGLEGDSGRT